MSNVLIRFELIHRFEMLNNERFYHHACKLIVAHAMANHITAAIDYWFVNGHILIWSVIFYNVWTNETFALYASQNT